MKVRKKSLLANLKTRIDSFYNSITGIGTSSRDKRSGGVVKSKILSQYDVEELFRGDDLGAIIAEKLPEEMFRKGFEIRVEGDKDRSEAVNAQLEDLGLTRKQQEATTWARVYGGAAIFLGIDDGKELSEPIDLEAGNEIKFLNVFHRYELLAYSYYGDPFDPDVGHKYGMPELYYFNPFFATPETPSNATNVLIHESRLLVYDGVSVSRRQRMANGGWGDSVFVRVFEVLRDFDLTWGAAANLLSDWSQGIYKLQGLNELIASDTASGNQDTVTARLQLLDMSRSVARAIVLDAGDQERPAEEFKRETASLAGMPEMLQQFTLRLAAAARMPVSNLFGQSPAGLNSTGDGDRAFYADQVAAQQRTLVHPQLLQFMKIWFAANGGEPENWCVKWAALDQLNELEESQRRLNIATADEKYIVNNVATSYEVTASRFGGDDFDGEGLVVDMASRAKLGLDEPAAHLTAPADDKKAQQEAALAAAKNPAPKNPNP